MPEARGQATEDVRCPRCGIANATGMRFCRACGSELLASQSAPSALPYAAGPPMPAARPAIGSCARCGGQNEVGSRFCKFCGSPLETTSIPIAQPAQPAAPAPRAGDAAASLPARAVRAPQPERSPGARPIAQVVVILRDGSEGGVYALDAEQSDIGSREGDIVLREDPYLSPRHARIERRGDGFALRDLGSENGVYFRLREPTNLASGDMFLIGQQVLRFELVSEAERRVGPAKQHGVMVFGTPETARIARVVQYTTEGLERDVHYLYRDETVFGREQADIVFAEDPFLSRRHAAITMDRERLQFALRDLGSSNGTALRCTSERALQHGDQFRLGRHLFRFDLIADSRGARSH